MSGIQQQLLGGPFGVAAYQIQRSLRFNSADSANLTRTPASASNRKTWTWSGWTKLSELKGQILFCCVGSQSDTSSLFIDFRSDATFRVTGWATVFRQTSQLFRDLSAWYHIVVALDTTQATANDRIKVYVNGSQVTAFATTNNPTQNSDLGINQASLHEIGKYTVGATGYDYYGGYITEMNFIDGQALTPSSFGETNVDTGVWQPTQYTGTYGTNGFYLNFSDNSGTTSTTLGKDYSGNGNNWTPNNFSVTAGVGNDSLVDTPTPYGTDTGAGGEVRGNYNTLNPLTTTAGTYTQGNLRYVGASSWRRTNSTISITTGKWYWEVTLGNAPYTPRASTTAYNAMGFGLSTTFNSTANMVSFTDAVMLGDNGWYKNFSGSITDTGTAFSSGDVLAIAVDLDANTFTFYRNNSSVGSGTIGGTAGRELTPCLLSYDGTQGVMDCNFGQRPFAYTAPSGFKALCTQNLPAPTVVQGDDYFNTVLYTATGSTQSITGVGFQPDLVWAKSRSNLTNHGLVDSVRGVSRWLGSNTTDAEDFSSGNYLTAFNSDGFTVAGGGNVFGATNYTYAAWNWKANGAGSSNTAGTITSTVSANTTAGFSIVTYTGNGSAGATVGHGLGATPSLIIVKARSVAGEYWMTYHTSLGNTKAIFLQRTDAEATSSTYWNNTSPTSTLFSLGTNGSGNGNGTTYVAYCFAPVAGFSAFGSYTGNGSTDGPFIYTGFRPAMIFAKQTNASGENWYLMDNKRSTFNLVNDTLYPNSTLAETVDNANVTCDFVANGFKIRDSYTGWNANGGTYIYAAFAENPFKYSLAR